MDAEGICFKIGALATRGTRMSDRLIGDEASALPLLQQRRQRSHADAAAAAAAAAALHGDAAAPRAPAPRRMIE